MSNKRNIIFILLFILICSLPLVYLVSRDTREDSWDNWDFGSAQTMLTARYWARDGFLQHKLLFLPAGYHSEIQILDRPEFQFLASGIATGGLIGKRTHYTHYPSFYLIPYGLLAKLGVESRFWFRALALFFSFGSVAFMAGFIYLVAKRNVWVVLLAVFYYVTSNTFLSYADSLNNTPIDDFLKWLILFLSVYCLWEANGEALKRRLKVIMWILYFILASVSYDSTFFIFFWLCALSFIETRKFNLKEYFYWAIAPILAFIVQFLQNIWYLGLKAAALDLWGAFFFRFSVTPQVSAGLNALPPVIKNIFITLSTVGYFSDLRTRFALPLVVLLAYLFFKNKFVDREISRFIPILAISGLIYLFILPAPAAYGYQGRQVAPALLLLFSLAVWKIIISLKEKNFGKDKLLVLFCLIALLTAHFYGLFGYAKQWPNNLRPEGEMAFFTDLNKISDSSTMIFALESVMPNSSNRFFQQYYSDRLILSFKDADTLLDYMNKIYLTIPGKVNFLLILSGKEYGQILNKLEIMKDYSVASETVNSLPKGFSLIRVFHK